MFRTDCSAGVLGSISGTLWFPEYHKEQIPHPQSGYFVFQETLINILWKYFYAFNVKIILGEILLKLEKLLTIM